MRSKTLARADSAWRLVVAIAVLVALTAGSASAAANAINVEVANKTDRVTVTVQGDRVLSFVPIVSTAGKYLGFQFPNLLAVKGRLVPIKSGAIYSVRYSDFRANPPASRIVVNTASRLSYATEWSPDKKRVAIHVMKAGFEAVLTAAPPEPDAQLVAETTEPSEPSALSPAAAKAPEPVTGTEARRAAMRESLAAYAAIAEKSRKAQAAVAAAALPGQETPAEPEVRVLGVTETTAAPPEAANPAEPKPRTAADVPPAVSAGSALSVPPKMPAVAERKVSVNFLDADINDVLAALAEQTGRNIVASTDVTGNVTVRLTNVSLEEALDYVARLSGYNYTKDNDTYLVSKLVGRGPDTKTELVKLSYAKADDVVALLKARFPDVVVSKVGVEQTGKTGGEPGGGQTAVGLKNNLLVLAGPEASVEEARALAEEFEVKLRKESIESTREIYRVKFAHPAQLANTITALVPGVEVVFAPTSDFELVKFKSAKSTSGAAPQVERDFDTSGRGNASGSGKADPFGGSAGQGDGAGPGRPVGAGAPTNARTLVIVGDEKSVAKALEIAAQLDVKSPQIKIDAKISSINKAGEKSLGFKWEWGDFAAIEGFTDYDKTTDTAPGVENKENTRIPHDRLIRQPWSILAALEALVTSGDAQVLASPSIVCLERNPGVFFVGDEVTYIQRIEVTPTGQNIVTDTKRVGVQMVAVGEINDDGYVTLYLHPEVSTLKLTVEQGVTLPIVSSRFTDHVVRVKSGETIVIGGLIRSDEIEEMSKVPLLGDLPLLGQLFRHRRTVRDHTEVVMFITASILQD